MPITGMLTRSRAQPVDNTSDARTCNSISADISERVERLRNATSANRGDDQAVDVPTGDRTAGTSRSRGTALGEEWRCFRCGEINGRKRLVSCSTCERWAHLTCVGLTQKQAETIPHWNCRDCRGVIATQPQPQSRPENFDLIKLLSDRRKTTRTVHFIPRGARQSAAEALTTLLRNVITTNSEKDWVRLICYPLWALQCPPLDNPEDLSLATLLKRQITNFMNSEWLPEFPLASDDNQRSHNSYVAASNPNNDVINLSQDESVDTEDRLRKRINRKFQDMDIRGAIREIASTEGLAPFSEETYLKLLERHPTGTDDALPPEPNNDIHPTPIVSTENVRKAILSFPAGSAGGPDGLSPDHLKSLISISMSETGRGLLTTLRDFSTHVADGQVPLNIRKVFFGASLCALTKEGGGVRPIAVGMTLRRMTTKTLIKPGSDVIGEYLGPHQLGYGTKGGCEAAVHAARHLIDNTREPLVFVKIDIKNAFNTIHRSHVLNQVSTNMANVYKFFHSAYAEPSTLFFDTYTIPSSTGVQQGDPGAPALFSIGIQQALQNLRSRFNTWYLDDASLIDDPATVLDDLRFLIPELQNIGLEINSIKCEIIFLNTDERADILQEFRTVLPDLRVTRIVDASLLGAPLSTEQLMISMQEKTRLLALMTLERLRRIDPHQAFVLLKSAFSLPKILYTLQGAESLPSLPKRQHLEGMG